MTEESDLHSIDTPRHPRGLLPLIGALIVGLIVATNVGNALWASWIRVHPIGLLALNSSNKYLLGTYSADFWPYILVSTGRLLVADPLFYALGYLYRGQALEWGRKVFPGFDPIIDQFEKDETGFKKLLNVLVVLAPNNPVSLLAGVAAMPIRRFFVLNIIGTVGRTLLIRKVGWIFQDQIDSVLDTVARYQGWFLRGSIIAVIAVVAWQFFGNRGLIGGVESLEEELGEPDQTSEGRQAEGQSPDGQFPESDTDSAS
ncbi:MAG TPA: hypothetical protein VL068_07935 [Microthrixaceae bacterium]|nr:hypothetical protein [Microthrixaceae bacterium]